MLRSVLVNVVVDIEIAVDAVDLAPRICVGRLHLAKAPAHCRPPEEDANRSRHVGLLHSSK